MTSAVQVFSNEAASADAYLGISRQCMSPMGYVGTVFEALNQVIDLKYQKRVRELETLRELITSCTTKGSIFEYTVSAKTAAYSLNTLQLLDSSLPLPRISVDSEGGLLMVWESQRSTLLATVTGNTIEITLHAGTPDAQYIEGVVLKGSQTPPELSRSLQSL